MKVSKIFGCVLGLHLSIIAILIVQPGCQTGQPPTQTYTQNRTSPSSLPSSSQNRAMPATVPGASRTSGDLIPATRAGERQGLDSAFNAGFDDGSDFGAEIDEVEPLEPLGDESDPDMQTVNIAGPSLETYTVKRGDNLWSIAKRYKVSLNELYAANGLNKNSVLRVGQQIQIPVEGSSARVNTVTPDAYQPSNFNEASTTYTVRRGDTLSKIANQYDTTVRALKAANGKGSDMIRVGEELIIPVGGANTSAPAASSVSASTSVSAPNISASGSRTHTVKAGEYPAQIARMYGMTTGELLAMNSITDPRKLRVGQQLRVSGSGRAANVDSRTETVVAPAPARPAPARSAATPAPQSAPSTGPVEIRVVEADPLVEEEMTEIETDDIFDNAVEIPVIRLEE
jgi:LysM repeat protein